MIIKCKMCGGDLNIQEENHVCECEFCGTKQTVPLANDEKKANLFNRANKLRMNADFDKAASVYASITAEFPEEAEAYWGLCLCKYGIEYVDDPATYRKIPTCHRTLPESIMDDSDFDQACENADPVAMRLYREEAKEIDRLQKAILGIVANEEPYDVFICYKETDETGERTEDSVIAQDIYDSLTEKGLNAFFARISLEAKLGKEYEPYIYAALHSSKVMLAIGTKFEYYNAAWVKNEWARYLAMMKHDCTKTLIPCYKDIDAYDMPKEFKNLQAQDMSKLGWMQDLIRGVKKLIQGINQTEKKEQGNPTADIVRAELDSSVKRGYLAMEDMNWDAARKHFDTALNYDAECADAYLGLALIDYRLSSPDQICAIENIEFLEKIEQNQSYTKFVRFASDEQKESIQKLIESTRVKLNNLGTQSKRTIEEVRKRIMPAQGLLLWHNNGFIGITADGRVLTYNLNSKLSDEFYGIIKVKAFYGVGSPGIVGFRADGTIVTEYKSWYSKWIDSRRDIKQIEWCASYQMGWQRLYILSNKGTICMIQRHERKGCSEFQLPLKEIDSIVCNDDYMVALDKYGHIKMYPEIWNCSGVNEWENIIAVSLSGESIIGIKSDGTVLTSSAYKVFPSSSNEERLLTVKQKWHDIVSICSSNKYIFGLKADGTVLGLFLLGDLLYGKSDESRTIEGWNDIVAITFESGLTGIKADGTALFYNYDKRHTETIPDFKLFNNIDTLEQDRASELPLMMKKMRKEKDEKKKREETKKELLSEQNRLRKELQGLSGLFTGKRRREIEGKLLIIDKELKEIQT